MADGAVKHRSRSRRQPGHVLHSLVWVRHGADNYWPALVQEVSSASLEVEFVEAGAAHYLTGTVSLASRTVPRVIPFYDGLVSYFSEEGDASHAHPWPFEALNETIR